MNVVSLHLNFEAYRGHKQALYFHCFFTIHGSYTAKVNVKTLKKLKYLEIISANKTTYLKNQYKHVISGIWSNLFCWCNNLLYQQIRHFHQTEIVFFIRIFECLCFLQINQFRNWRTGENIGLLLPLIHKFFFLILRLRKVTKKWHSKKAALVILLYMYSVMYTYNTVPTIFMLYVEVNKYIRQNILNIRDFQGTV